MEMIKLEQNYRSTGNILNAANTLIANNSHVFDKKLWCEMGDGDLIRVVSTEDEDDELECWRLHRAISKLSNHRSMRW